MGELPLNQVVCGDCQEVMSGFPENSIDLVVTSPPYWGLRDYGEETVRIWGGDLECEHEWNIKGSPPRKRSKKDVKDLDSKQATYKNNSSVYDSSEVQSDFCSNCGAWRGSLGLEPHPQMFIDHLVYVFRGVKRVLNPSGSFWLNLGDTYCSSGKWVNKEVGDIGKQNRSVEGGAVNAYSMRGKLKPDGGWIRPKQLLGIPWRVAIALQNEGWILRNDIIWYKPNHMPSSVKDRLTCSYEHVFLFVKQRRYYFDLDAIRKPHSASTIQRITQPNVMNQLGGDKQRELRGEAGGNASRSADMVKSLARNIDPIISESRKDLHGPTYRRHQFSINGGQAIGLSLKGKNPGDMWNIPTQPFPGAHFAVFPQKLIEPIIKAGCPRWICSKCRKPRERISETEYVKSPVHGDGSIMGRRDGGDKLTHYNGLPRVNAVHHTVGWSDCGCGADWVGGVVLDPFAGSGTALRVARRLGRRFIGIEINPEYAEMCKIRVRSDSYKPPPAGVSKLEEALNES